MMTELERLRAKNERLKMLVLRWVSKWSRTVDDLTATKGEIERLREALERMIMPVLMERLTTEGDHYQTLPDNLPVNTGATYGDVRRAIAALSTSADDWLAEHDAEVRSQERERCIAEWRAEERCIAEWGADDG